MLTIGALFAGIGGLELGLEWAGLGPTLWQVEKDPEARAVLAQHWPDVERFDDVCAVGGHNLRPVDLLCGGFPCQDVSSAGRQAGLAGARSGLWYEFARVAQELRPRWIVVENVASGASKWVDAVRGDLERLGYASLPVPLAADDCGAPHLRSRIFLVAHALQAVDRPRVVGGDVSDPVLRPEQDTAEREGSGRREANTDQSAPCALADVDGQGQLGSPQAGQARERGGHGALHGTARTQRWAARPEVGPLVHGLPRGVGKLRDRLLGNSVTPPCAEVVGWVIRHLAKI